MENYQPFFVADSAGKLYWPSHYICNHELDSIYSLRDPNHLINGFYPKQQNSVQDILTVWFT
jgi:hypothetical protein